MVDDRVEGSAVGQVVPAGVRLAVHHHHGARLPAVRFFDGNQVEVEQLDHRPVLGPADEAVAGQAGGLAQAHLDQVSQAHHAGETVGVGVDVGNERYAGCILKTVQKTVGTSGA